MGVYEEIEFIVDEVENVEGVIGAVLFGSYSRGDYDEGSDIDILVIFKDEESLKENQEAVYGVTAKSRLFLQAISLTPDELKSSTLLKTILRDGRVYYADKAVKRLLSSPFKPYALITYKTAKLKPKERVVFSQRLEGRRRGKYRYNGIIQKLSGYKVGRGVMMIPMENLKTITDHLDREGVNHVIRYVWT